MGWEETSVSSKKLGKVFNMLAGGKCMKVWAWGLGNAYVGRSPQPASHQGRLAG